MIQIYTPSNTDYSKNGDQTLLPVSASVHAILNGAWEAEITHTIDAEGRWKYITEEAVIKMPSFNGDQLFRVKTAQKQDSGVTATMEPIFYDSMGDCWLSDVRPTGKNGQDALDIMLAPNSKYSGLSNITRAATAYYQNMNFMQALNGDIDQSFINRWGGEIMFDNFTVIVNDRVGGDYGIELRYGKNIPRDGMSYEVDTRDVVTRIYPQAYNGYKMTGNGYVDSPLINNYPTVKSVSMTFDNVKMRDDAQEDDEENGVIICDTQEELDAALTQQCETQYDAGIDKPTVTISADMVLLQNTEQYKDIKTLEAVSLGDTIHCINTHLDITTDARVIEIEFDAVRKKVSSVVIGDFQQQYFDGLTDSAQKIDSVINPDGSLMAEKVQGILNGIYTQLRLQSTVAEKVNGHAFIVEDLDEESDLYGAMVWGTQGLQLSTTRTADGRGWDWTTAITAQGIVANAIIAGILSDKTGKNYWNLDTGEFRLSAEAFEINDQTVQDYVVDNLTQEEVFNILTNNGASQGIYMQDGKLYINGTYIKGGTISGQTIEGGSFTTYNNGYLASRLIGTGIKFYDWAGDRSFVGAVESIHNSQLNRGNVAFYSDENSSVTIGYTTDDPEEPNASITPVISFDPQNPTSSPYMINTSSGTLFNHNPSGGIVVENGLLKDWSIKSVLDNTLNVISSLSWNGNGELTSVQRTSVDIKDGLIVGWTVKTFDV